MGSNNLNRYGELSPSNYRSLDELAMAGSVFLDGKHASRINPCRGTYGHLHFCIRCRASLSKELKHCISCGTQVRNGPRQLRFKKNIVRY